LNPGSGVGNAR